MFAECDDYQLLESNFAYAFSATIAAKMSFLTFLIGDNHKSKTGLSDRL